MYVGRWESLCVFGTSNVDVETVCLERINWIGRFRSGDTFILTDEMEC